MDGRALDPSHALGIASVMFFSLTGRRISRTNLNFDTSRVPRESQSLSSKSV
jgi:hypothetical protein